MKCRIALVESRLQLRNGLLLLLNAMPTIECLATFPNAASALAALPQVQPDVIITALDLPDVADVADFVRHLSTQSAPILILTNNESDELLTHCIECGAMGYLPKGVPPNVLQEMALNLASGRAEISTPNAHRLLHLLRHLPRTSATTLVATHHADISLLDLFAHGYTVKDIAEQLLLSPEDVKKRTFQLLRHIQKLHREIQKELYPHVGGVLSEMEEGA